MKKILLKFVFASICFGTMTSGLAQNTPQIETIVFLRHGEKPEAEIGQLNCKGLNRSLKLPAVLLKKFGKPNYIFAPNASIPFLHKGKYLYYFRPLATIEPFAIETGLPINDAYAYDQARSLALELLDDKYVNSLIVVAWEHEMIGDVIVKLSEKTGLKNEKTYVWPNQDYDTIIVVKIKTNTNNKKTITLTKDTENLSHALSEQCPK